MKKTNISYVLILIGSTLALMVLLLSAGCTENERAKQFGGTMNVTVPAGEKFINATWKNDDLWIITEDTARHIFYMHEVSNYGIMQGTVIIK